MSEQFKPYFPYPWNWDSNGCHKCSWENEMRKCIKSINRKHRQRLAKFSFSMSFRSMLWQPGTTKWRFQEWQQPTRARCHGLSVQYFTYSSFLGLNTIYQTVCSTCPGSSRERDGSTDANYPNSIEWTTIDGLRAVLGWRISLEHLLCRSACTHLLPWWRIPPCHHAVHRASPSVAGFFQFQVWLLQVAASPLWERYQFPLQGLLAACQFSLPHTQTAGSRTLGAQKGGIRVQGSPVKSAELCVHTISTSTAARSLLLQMRTAKAGDLKWPSAFWISKRNPCSSGRRSHVDVWDTG